MRVPAAPVGLLAALLFAGAADHRPLAAQATPADPEAVIYELRLGRSESRTTVMFRRGDTLLVPVLVFCELAEIRCRARADGGVDGTLEPGAQPLRIPAGPGSAQAGGRRTEVTASETWLADGERFIATRVLADLFETSVLVQSEDLLVTVPDLGALPIGQRFAREARRRTLRRQLAGPAAPDRVLAGERPLLDGLVLDYTLQGTVAPGGGTLAGGALALGAHVLGGALTTAWTRNAAFGGVAPPFRASWIAAWHDRPWLRQLRIGDAVGTGPAARFARGVAITNTPYLRPFTLGSVGFGGALPEGWAVEAFQGDRLIGFDSLGGRTRWGMPLPVAFGENLIDFVATGPFGETRRFTRAYRVLTEMIPAGTVEYGVSAGSCLLLACRQTMNADLRWGVNTRLTLRAGHDQFVRDSLGALAHPYLGASATLGPALSASVLAQARAVSRVVLGYEPSFAQRYFLTASVSDPDVAQPLLSVPGERQRVGLSALWRSPDQQDRFFVQANAFHTTTRTGTFAQVRLAVSTQQGPWRLSPFIREDRAVVGASQSLRRFAGTDFFATVPRSAGRWLAGGLVRGQFEQDATGLLRQGSAFFGQLLRGWLRVEVGATWFAGTRPVWLLSINGDRAQVRTFTTASAVAGTRPAGSQTVQGSMVFERRTARTEFFRGPAIERAGLVGRVYTDLDGDGRFGPGDESVPDAIVRAGGLAARSDAQGWYRLWDLVPFEPVVAEVDLTTVRSPLWVPRTGRVEVVPEPHRFTALDLVLEPGGTLDGTVVQRSAGREFGVGGVPVTLTREGDDTSRTLVSFGDGEFSAFALRAGRWRVGVLPSYLARAGLSAEPVTVTLASALDGDAPPPVRLRLRPDPLLDADADGVPDDDDACPGTPPGTVVDSRGCGEPPPLDGDADGDGVQDSRDACPDTPRGTTVDARGCRAVFAPAQRTLVLRGVRFETGHAILTPESFAVLDDIALALRDAASVRVEVGGHTDATGSAATNRRLSQQRAEVVRYYLIRRGVAAEQLTARGYGPSRPVAPNATPAGRALNRRTELTRLDPPPPRRDP